MLPTGPRSTYQMPATTAPGDRELARQILTSIRAENARAQEVRTGLMSTGCDGQPTINPLDGTTCNPGDTVVLFNPATRKVIGTLGKPATAGPGTVVTAPASCDVVRARLKARRRFIDNLGNVYGPSGKWLSYGYDMAALGTEYVHRMTLGEVFTLTDPPSWKMNAAISLAKVAGMTAALDVQLWPTAIIGGRLRGAPIPWPLAMNGAWPSAHDVSSGALVMNPLAAPDSHTPYGYVAGLNDVVYSGPCTSTDPEDFTIIIDGVGTPDTFKYKDTHGADVTGIPITANPLLPQALSLGVSVAFGATTGHTLGDSWTASFSPQNIMERPGVAARGTVTEARACINGGSPNNNVLLTSEDDLDYSKHALVVRNPDTLELLYRKPLAHDGTGYTFTTPQRFSFSANDEGLFYMQAYTAAAIASPPTPFPGAEFGSPNPRVIAVVSVDPLTFEPTITELITLETNGRTAGSTFAVAVTV